MIIINSAFRARGSPTLPLSTRVPRVSRFASLWPSFLRRGPGRQPPTSKVHVQPLEQHPPGSGDAASLCRAAHGERGAHGGPPVPKGCSPSSAHRHPSLCLDACGICSGDLLGGGSFQQASALISPILNQPPFLWKDHVINRRLKRKTVSLVSQRGGWSQGVENTGIGPSSATLQWGDLGQVSGPRPPSVFSSAKDRG